MMRHEGWEVNPKRVERIWHEEGLKVPQRQKKRRRLWLNDGSCIRLRPEYPNNVWSYDFMQDRTHDGRSFRILNLIDEYSRECLSVKVGRSLRAEEVVEALTGLFCRYGIPEYIRSDTGSKFTARKVRGWLERLGVQTVYIEPRNPWENGYIESFNGKMRDELLNREVIDTIVEAKVLVERWRLDYNHIRPHSSLGYRPPAPEVKIPLSA